MKFFYDSLMQMKKMLANVEKWLDAAVAFAEKKSFDPNTLLTARLAPDQYALVRQVQSACDAVKFGAARLGGKEPPRHPDTEQTIDELRARIKKCSDWLATLTPADFEGAETRQITLPRQETKWATGYDYFHELVVPNFYFHVAHTYAILRHNGVDLGKRDYLGRLSVRDR
jgi:hypothetical protein